MVSRSAVGLAGRSLLVHMRFQSLPLLRVAGTVTAERNLQRLQRWHANHTGRVNANESKTRFVQVEGSNCIKCHTQAALAFVPEFARLTLPGLRAALLFQGTLPAITAAGGVKPWRAPSRSDWRPRPPKAATMSHPRPLLAGAAQVTRRTLCFAGMLHAAQQSGPLSKDPGPPSMERPQLN
jgi:hypothetical protein